MIRAIAQNPMAHQWRKPSAPLLKVALREKGNGFGCAITLFPMAQPGPLAQIFLVVLTCLLEDSLTVSPLGIVLVSTVGFALLMVAWCLSEIAKIAKVAMPRGSKPGERRGGRQKGTPNKSTALKKAALSAASADPTTTPLQFLLDVMRNPTAPTGLRVQVARAAAPLVHGKAKITSVEDHAGNPTAVGGPDGFTIDIAVAKAFRDMEHRLAVFLRKRYGPSENGGPLTAAEIVEESELDALFRRRAAALVCPPGYGPGDATEDLNRLHQLNCKRLSPPACGGGELKGTEDEEEAFLTARVAAFRHSQEGRDWDRITELEVFRVYRSDDEQAELNNLKTVYGNAASWRQRRR